MPTLAFVFLSSVAAAQSTEPAPPADASTEKEAKSGPSVKAGGVVMPRYSYEIAPDGGGANEFDLDRSYIRLDAKLDDRFAARVTVDANQQSPVDVTLPDGTEVEVPADTRLRVFLKHAWLEYRPVSDVQVRFGMVDTPFLPWEESFENLRYLFKSFLDDVKLESTTDFGLSASGKHAKGLLGWGAGVYNGEFYTSPEVDAGKSFQARVSIDPLAPGGEASLPVGVFVDEELHTGADAETVVGGLAGFDHDYLLVTAQVDAHLLGGLTGLGESALIRPNVPDVGFLIGRVDHFDPDTATDADGQLRLWAGLGRDLREKVSVAALFEMTTFEDAAEDPIETVAVHSQIGF